MRQVYPVHVEEGLKFYLLICMPLELRGGVITLFGPFERFALGSRNPWKNGAMMHDPARRHM